MDRLAMALNSAPAATQFPAELSGLLIPAALAAGLALLLAIFIGVGRAGRRRAAEAAYAAERQREMERAMALIARQNAELAGRIRSVAEGLGSRQSDLARFVAERLDSVGARVGAGVEASGKSAGEQLARLNERLAVIDAAQSRLTGLAQEVVGLKEILANKQSRGAFGQGRLEAIVRDALPERSYAFQHTLSNRTRPDCVIRLPGDPRLMVIDAKFPLEAFNALKSARDEAARANAAARVRADVGKHVKDIAERYFLPDETQDIALLFVPSESLYADINEHFTDVVEKAHRSRIIIVSPSLMMMAVQLMQALVRDARTREETHLIQAETRRLVEDVEKMRARAEKLGAHFQSAEEDVAEIVAAAGRIARTGARIDRIEISPADDGERLGERLKAAE